MKRNRRLTGVLILMGCMLLTGCGSAASSEKAAAMAEYSTTDSSYKSDDIYNTDTMEYAEEATTAEEAVSDSGSTGIEVQSQERKLIRTVDLDVETEEFDKLNENILAKVEQYKGYIEYSNTYNGSNYHDEYNMRNANMTIRIPAEKLDDFLSSVSEVSNIISKSENVSDMTLQYVDMNSHKEALQTEQTRLLELMEQAEKVEDIIVLEDRLSEIRYQIESMESQLRTFDNQVSYSTVNLNISEVHTYTPTAERSRWEKTVDGFQRSLVGVGVGLLDFLSGLVIALPYLIVWAVIITVIIIIIRMMIKRNHKKKAAKQQKLQEEAAARQAAYLNQQKAQQDKL